MRRKSLLASDFDQTLSFNDSGVVLSELIGFRNFHDKFKGLGGSISFSKVRSSAT